MPNTPKHLKVKKEGMKQGVESKVSTPIEVKNNASDKIFPASEVKQEILQASYEIKRALPEGDALKQAHHKQYVAREGAQRIYQLISLSCVTYGITKVVNRITPNTKRNAFTTVSSGSANVFMC